MLSSFCRLSTPSKDLARSLIDRDHAVRRCLRTSCHITDVIGTGAPNKLVTLMATQRWLWCCCGRGGRAARSLTRINIYVLPPPTVRSLQDTPILVGPESPMGADGIISTTKSASIVVLNVPLDGQVVPVVAHAALKHVPAFWTNTARPLA